MGKDPNRLKVECSKCTRALSLTETKSANGFIVVEPCECQQRVNEESRPMYEKIKCKKCKNDLKHRYSELGNKGWFFSYYEPCDCTTHIMTGNSEVDQEINALQKVNEGLQQDLKHWQNEYVKVQQELEQAQSELSELKEKVTSFCMDYLR